MANTLIPPKRIVPRRKPQSLLNFVKNRHLLTFQERIQGFYRFVEDSKQKRQYTYCRKVLSSTGRIVTVLDPYDKKPRNMLMFASNNYLGLANHPHIVKKVTQAMHKYGVGIGGPPLLNGYSKLNAELEERLACFKHQESALIFSSGYGANLGLIEGLIHQNDAVVFDNLSHASFYDGLRQTKAIILPFQHNNIKNLEVQLERASRDFLGTLYVGLEGVYSMDGDLAPLDKMVPLFKKYNAICLLDDAHGTGIMGKTGSGTAEHFGLSTEIDISMGTFSKTFAVTGGFLAASKEVINYLRFFARTYMFSAALPPFVLASVLAGLEVIEKEFWLRDQLFEIRNYAIEQLQKFGFYRPPQAAIIALKIPKKMNIRKANYEIHQRGIFLNAIEYPAVSQRSERFRISLMAQHTKEDIDQLAAVLEEVYNNESNYLS